MSRDADCVKCACHGGCSARCGEPAASTRPAAAPVPGGEALTLEAFCMMNRRRCESYHGFSESLHPSSKYTAAHWILSALSELGEAADALVGAEGLKERRAGKSFVDVAEELADAITYCDLAIQKLGFWTPAVLIQKFNRVNERAGFGSRFTLPQPAGATPALAASPGLQTEGEACMACKGSGGRLLDEGVTAHFDSCTYCRGTGRSQRAANPTKSKE